MTRIITLPPANEGKRMSPLVRCRIAPSPTGEPHVGTAYIALFNWCLARKLKGQFILRIEDTDQARSTASSEQMILESLKWLGLDWDEGPDCGGPHGPYRQSERLSIYHEYIEHLLAKGAAYRCFCTPEDLSLMRKAQMADKAPLGYYGPGSPCRHLSGEEVQQKVDQGIPHVIRLAVPAGEDLIGFIDHVRGETISRKLSEVDDQVLIKSDGFPTYHFASVVDDHLMQISHIIRGEEWINSTYKHVLLYQAFGWELPEFYHVGLLRNPDANKSKISKRKNPVSLRWFRAAGYRPDALINFMGLMGYSRSQAGMSLEEQKRCEIFDRQSLIQDFDPTRFNPTGAAFDFVKLDDINFQYVSSLSEQEFYEHLTQRILYLRDYFKGFNDLISVRYLRGEKEITYWTSFLFKQHLDYSLDHFAKAKLESWKQGADCLQKFRKLLKKKVDTLNSFEVLEAFMEEAVPSLDLSKKSFMMLLRVTITGNPESLPLLQAMWLFGPYRCLIRLEEAATFLKRAPR